MVSRPPRMTTFRLTLQCVWRQLYVYLQCANEPVCGVTVDC